MRRKFIVFIFLLLTVINLLVFFFRDHFQYQPYADYRSLYDICDEKCAKKWSQYIDDYPQAEFAEAKKITDSVIHDSLSGYDKVLQLGSFLYNRFKNQIGRPSENLLSVSPLNQYKKFSSSDSAQLWCGNFAAIFSYFCWTQDIACRNIEIMNPGDHHVLNECYLPELGRWVMVDLTNNMIMVRNKTGAFLDLQAVRDSVQKTAPLLVYQLTEDSIQKKILGTGGAPVPSYYLVEHPMYYYHRINNEKIYTTGNKIRRYFLANSWYDIFVDKKPGNLLFHLKQFVFILWIISFFVFFISRTKFKT